MEIQRYGDDEIEIQDGRAYVNIAITGDNKLEIAVNETPDKRDSDYDRFAIHAFSEEDAPEALMAIQNWIEGLGKSDG